MKKQKAKSIHDEEESQKDKKEHSIAEGEEGFEYEEEEG